MKLAPDFPCLADEIAEPHPDMNIKVAAFTVSEKSSNTYCIEALVLFVHFSLKTLENEAVIV